MAKNSVKISVFVLLLALSGAVMADDSPDIGTETKLHDKYVGQALSPVDDGEWQMVSGQTPHNTYTTKKKESLMEISEMLFGDSHFWTKLWSINKQISNPYEVPPGTVISVTASGKDAPSFGINFYPVREPEKMGDPASPDILGYTLNAEIPANGHERVGALNALPDTLPPWKYRADPDGSMLLDLDRPIVTTPVAIKNLDFFVTEEIASEVEGEVVGTEMGMKTASEFQYVYVKLKNPGNVTNYTVILDEGEIASEFTSRKPIMVQVQGAIEVQNVIDSRKNIYRALVKKSISQVEVGAKLVLSTLPTYTVTSNDPLSSATTTIIGGHFNTIRHLFGAESVVFLDHGKSEGLSEGQLFPVYQFQRAKLDGKFVKENPMMVGHIKIVKTSNHFSTAVVTDSNHEIEVGDCTSPDLTSRR